MNYEKNNPFYEIKDVCEAENILNKFFRDHPDALEGAENILYDLFDALLNFLIQTYNCIEMQMVFTTFLLLFPEFQMITRAHTRLFLKD